MIVYNGVSLNSVAGVSVEDIHVAPIQYEQVVKPRAIRGGSDFIRSRAGTRTVTITFGLLNDNKISRKAALMAISSWAKTDKEYRLELPDQPNFYLTAVCTAKPEPSMRQWWESKLRLVFTCFSNPYWTSKSEKAVSCNTEFYVQGDAPPLMRIENTFGSAASNQSYSIAIPQGSSSLVLQTMTFSTIPAGDMVIDLDKETAVVGSTDIMQYYNVNSKFLVPRIGRQTIAGTGTIKYRERFE